VLVNPNSLYIETQLKDVEDAARAIGVPINVAKATCSMATAKSASIPGAFSRALGPPTCRCCSRLCSSS